MLDLIEPKVHIIDGQEFIFSLFPATEWREIVSGYPLTGMPKVGDYASNKTIMLKLMSYVAIPMPNGAPPLRLTTEGLINAHIRLGSTLVKVEWGMLQHNCDFLADGRISGFLEGLLEKLPEWITKILTQLSEKSSTQESPPSTN